MSRVLGPFHDKGQIVALAAKKEDVATRLVLPRHLYHLPSPFALAFTLAPGQSGLQHAPGLHDAVSMIERFCGADQIVRASNLGFNLGWQFDHRM